MIIKAKFGETFVKDALQPVKSALNFNIIGFRNSKQVVRPNMEIDGVGSGTIVFRPIKTFLG